MVLWIEVIAVVVKNAGERRSVKMPNRSETAVTTEMIWSNEQKRILEHLRIAEKIWKIKLIHGKRVGDTWRDFVVVGESFRSLRFYLDPGDTIPDNILDALIRIRDHSKTQRLTENPLFLIYTDKFDTLYSFKNEDKKWLAVGGRRGTTWHKKDKKNLPFDVSFIFPESCDDTTAHELGHLVANLDHTEERGNIMMLTPDCVKRQATEEQLRRFQRKSIVQKTPVPRQGWRPGLSLPPVLD
jgi:hypothetical protein